MVVVHGLYNVCTLVVLLAVLQIVLWTVQLQVLWFG